MVYIDGAKEGDPRVPNPEQPPNLTTAAARPPMTGPPAFDDGSLNAAVAPPLPPSTTTTSSASIPNAASGAGSVSASGSAAGAMPQMYQQYQQPAASFRPAGASGPSVLVRHPAPGAAYGSMTAAPYNTIAINTGSPAYTVVPTQPQQHYPAGNGQVIAGWRQCTYHPGQPGPFQCHQCERPICQQCITIGSRSDHVCCPPCARQQRSSTLCLNCCCFLVCFVFGFVVVTILLNQ